MAATPLTTTLTLVRPNLWQSSFSMTSVTASATSGLKSFSVPKIQGKIVEFEVQFAEAGEATISIYSKDGESTGSLYEILKATDVATSFHVKLEKRFLNAQSTPVNDLYIEVTETGGASDTGVMTFFIWVEA